MTPWDNLDEAEAFTLPYGKQRLEMYFNDMVRVLGKQSKFDPDTKSEYSQSN